MKIKRRLFSLFLSLIMIVMIVPWSALNASASYSGALQFNANGKFTVMSLNDIQDNSDVDDRVITMITKAIARYHPDLVVFVGDNTTGGLLTSQFQSSVNEFLAPLINTGTKFAVTFGNHDDESIAPSKSTQYDYFISHGGNCAIDQDVDALSGVGSGVIPIYPNGQTSGTPAFQVYLMDSGTYASSGYDCPYTDQIDYYIQRSLEYPNVPSLWYQHIIVPDVYTKTMTQVSSGTANSITGSSTPYSSYTWALNPSLINWSKSGLGTSLSEIYKEAPCPANQSTYESSTHRSSTTYGSKTLYEAWASYGNLLGAYFGHDHKNSFVMTTTDGIDIGYSKGATLNSYNDGNPGLRIYQLDDGGTYDTFNVTEADLNKVNVSFNANGGTGTMGTQIISSNSSGALNSNAFLKAGYAFTGWATSPNGDVIYGNGANIAVGSSDITLYAKWEQILYNITFIANGGTGGTSGQLAPGSLLTPPNLTKEGYTLSSWSPSLPSTVPSADTTYTAQWQANTYNIKYLGNGNTSGNTVDSLHYYDVSSNLSKNDFTKTGYRFLGWSTSYIATVPTYTDAQSIIKLTTTPSDIITFYAVWAINQYLIAFNANGGTGGASGEYYTYGTELTAPEVAKNGYTFLGWQPELSTTVPGADTTYIAQWEPKSYNINFDANGGSGSTGGNMQVDSALNAPEVTRTGYTFAGWEPLVPEKVPAADTTYKAQWNAMSFNITFEASGGSGGTNGLMTFGTTLTPPAVSKPGYTLVGWSPELPATVPAVNTTYKAQWELSSNNLILSANGGTGGTSMMLDFGSPITPPNVSKEGYLFVGWSPALPSAVVGGMNTYDAQWKVNSYKITFDANGGSGTTCDLKQYGSQLTAPAVSKPGFTFTGWSPSVPSTVPAENKTYTAQWSRNKIQVTFDANGGVGGTINMMSYRDTLTPPAVTKTGYIFTGWTPAVPSKVIEGNQKYTATWIPAS